MSKTENKLFNRYSSRSYGIADTAANELNHTINGLNISPAAYLPEIVEPLTDIRFIEDIAIDSNRDNSLLVTFKNPKIQPVRIGVNETESDETRTIYLVVPEYIDRQKDHERQTLVSFLKKFSELGEDEKSIAVGLLAKLSER